MKTKDERGRFLKGNPSQALQPGEVRLPHPYIVGKDTKGRALPGYGHLHRYPETLMKLRVALVEAVSPEQIQEVINELRKLCLPGEHGPQVQLHAIALFLDRLLGKPSQEVLVQRNQTHTVKMDFSKLPAEKLRQLESIVSESETIIDVEPEARAEAE